MKRRAFLTRTAQTAALAGAPALWQSARAADGLSADQILIGSSLPLTGALAGDGQAHAKGIEAAFAEVNKAGGINGRELKAMVLDDGYKPERTAENMKQLLQQQPVFALLSVLGTGNNLAALPLIDHHEVPAIGPVTGAQAVRKPNSPNMFFVRASYHDETVRLVQQLTQMGLKQIAIVYLDNPFGAEIAKDAHAELAKAQLTATGSYALAVDGQNAAALADAVLSGKPNAVLLGTAGSATTAFSVPLRERASAIALAGLSVAVNPIEVPKMGTALQGFASTQVVPDATKPTLAAERRYAAAMRAIGANALDGSSFESWINAQVLIEGLKRAGKDLTREKLRAALNGLQQFDVGGFRLGYGGAQPYVASSFVDLAVFATGGKRLA